MSTQHILIFGDQAVGSLQAVQKLSTLSRTCPSLKRFLREAVDVIQAECAKTTLSERECYGTFDSLLELAEHHSNRKEPEDLVNAVLIRVVRIDELIL